MSDNHDTHIVKYRTYIIVLLALIALTSISVAITGLDLGRFAVMGALVLASIKAGLVLWHFMHLKYESGVIRMMVGMVMFVFLVVIIITFLDYGF